MQVKIRLRLIIILTASLFTSCFSTSHSHGKIKFRYACYKQSPEGCSAVKGIVLGLEFDWTIAHLNLQKDTLSGRIEYASEKQDRSTGKWVKPAYDRTLYIFNVDTISCTVNFLDSSKTGGAFKINAKDNSVFAFTYYKNDVEANIGYQRCIVIENK